MNEIWKDIKGYEGYYQISNLGRVKGLKRLVNHKCGKRIVEEKILKQGKDTYGYLRVNLSKEKGAEHCSIARAIAQAFIPNPENKPQVNHIDGIKTNNNILNLEWCTAKENIQHAFTTGLRKPQHKKVLMLSLDNKPIRSFDSLTEAATTTKTNIGSISQCCRGKRTTASKHKWQYT